MKVALIEAQRQGLPWSARDIVALATRNAAEILNWGNLLGSLEAGKKADLFAIDAGTGDPYEALLKSHEAAIQLIMINGVPRLGTAGMMKQMDVPGESLRVGRTMRILNLAQETADPDVGKKTLGSSKASLDAALKNLPQLAQDIRKKAVLSSSASRAALAHQPRQWFLALDELEDPELRCGRASRCEEYRQVQPCRCCARKAPSS